MQPERLGAYSSTLNPGFDPALPLYQTWPLFDAVKAAFAPGGPQPCAWDHAPALPTARKDQSPAWGTISHAQVLGQANSRLRTDLMLAGVKVDEASSLVWILDGSAPPKGDLAGCKKAIDAALAGGATLLVWNPTPTTLETLNALLPKPLELTPRSASQLLIKAADPLVAGLSAGELYFSEQNPSQILRWGLSGPLVKEGRVLLAAASTDWLRWNSQAETTKTVGVLRSEREVQAEGVALAVSPAGSGRVVAVSLVGMADTQERLKVARQILANSGLKLSEPRSLIGGGLFNNQATLERALVCGGFPAPTLQAGAASDYLNKQTGVMPRAGERVGECLWQAVKGESNGLFDFKRLKLTGEQDHAAVYVSFWLHSPRPLDDLLIEPDIPKVDLLLGCDDAMQLWLNGALLVEDISTHPAVIGQRKAASLPLKRGWNRILVKVIQGTGAWQFGARLECNKPGFLAELRSAVEVPRE